MGQHAKARCVEQWMHSKLLASFPASSICQGLMHGVDTPHGMPPQACMLAQDSAYCNCIHTAPVKFPCALRHGVDPPTARLIKTLVNNIPYMGSSAHYDNPTAD